MANIRLKELLEANVDPKLVARSKESGKLVYFKTQQAKDAALKAGSHLDPKAEKGGKPKADAKPNDMFGGDYAKDRGTEAPNADASVDGQTDDELYNALSDMGYDFGELDSDDFDENGFADAAMNLGYRWDDKNKVWNHRDTMGDDAPKADVKSIVKGILKTADKEFAGTHKLKDITDDITVDTSDNDGKELQSRIDKGEDGIYVQTGETEGTVVFKDGSQYQFGHVEDGPIPITKVSNEEPKTSSKLTSMLPKKASQLKYKHAESLETAINAETGLEGIAQTDDNGSIIYNANNGSMPTYTLYMGSNVDYGNPDEFRVSLESTYANDPADLSGKIHKTFKSGDEAMAFAIDVAKKYKKELKMDIDDDVNESTKLTSMIKK